MNKKISALDPLATPADGDILPITDVSDTITSGSADGTTKGVTVANLMAVAPVQTADISGLATQVSLGNHEALTSSVHGISAFGATLVDDASASAARTTLGLGTAATSASTDFSSAFYSTVSQTTTSRTLSDSDNGKVIVCTNASTITVTIPSTLTAGFSCKLVQGGAGIVGVSAGSGTTLSLIGGKAFTSGQYQVVDLINYATNAYVLDSHNLQTDPAAWSGNTYSISLDGVTDYGSMTQTDLPVGARSWSFWYKFSSTGSGIKGIWGSDTYNRYLGVDASNGYFYTNDGSGAASAYFNTGITFNTTDWYHAVLTDNGSGALNFYANGASKTAAGNQNQGAWRIKYIGRYLGASTVYFPGKIDEVAYFDYALTSSQATNIYKGEDDGGSGGTNGTAGDLSTFGPEHWWRMGDFEGGIGSSVADQGGAASTLDLTLSGASFASDAP